ncbi:MAG: hypothetical protein M0D54_00100 [Hyphomonadaceae bacterium JAD_PAG50586_4]|nr:MAG: hypothetical protein M0D54_00100 [Hyphomonadaceae bacterium JAD_PAG50586_4]
MGGADTSKMFAKLDADGDGQLTQVEMTPGDGQARLSSDIMSGLLSLQSGGEDPLLTLFSDTSDGSGAASGESSARQTETSFFDILMEMGRSKDASQAIAATRQDNAYRLNQQADEIRSGKRHSALQRFGVMKGRRRLCDWGRHLSSGGRGS